MTVQIKLSCTFDEIAYLSPQLDLYSCIFGSFNQISYPPDIILTQDSNGDISYNINSYSKTTNTKIKCYWDKI